MNFICDLAFQSAKSVLAGSIYVVDKSVAGLSKSQQADNEEQAALELTPKAHVLEGQGIQGYFEIKSLRNGISRGFQEEFFTADAMLFRQNTHKTRNNAVKMSQVFHDIAPFKRFTDLNLFKYAFSVIQNWEFYSMVPIFCQQLWWKDMKVASQGWLTSQQFWPATGPY